jgi:heme exporter protein A
MSAALAHRPHAVRHAALTLTVDGLAVDRGGRRVLSMVGFTLEGGEALIVTGRNGVGKSTLLRTLAGLLPQRQGRVTLKGSETPELAAYTHYLAHADGLKAALTARENLAFWGAYLAHESGPELSRTPEEALAAVGLPNVAQAPVGVLSAGQKRRVALARLLVAARPLWLLDEPLTALDAASRLQFAQVMRDHCAQGGMIIAATHEPIGLEGARFLPLGAPS